MSLAEESRYVTTFITPRGCYMFKHLPFGLSDMSESFQKMMEQILFGIDKVEISIDDVHAESMHELIKLLGLVFERFSERNLTLNRSKCEFGLKEMTVLGHVMSAEGINPDPRKTEAIRQTPLPKNLTELRSFLGTCGMCLNLFKIMLTLLSH